MELEAGAAIGDVVAGLHEMGGGASKLSNRRTPRKPQNWLSKELYRTR